MFGTETIDKDFDTQGLYPKLLLAQAIQHAHLDGETAACDQIAQDGNFDAVYEIKDDKEDEGKLEVGGSVSSSSSSSSEEEESDSSDESEDEKEEVPGWISDEPDNMQPALVVPDEVDEAGPLVGGGDTDVQVAHPMIRRRAVTTARQLAERKA